MIFITILFQCHPCLGFKLLSKVALGRKAQIGSNFNIRIIGISQQVFYQLELFLCNKIYNRNTLMSAK